MCTSIPNIAIVILAAGASSRMGSPKQLLKWGNDSLLNHAINIALRAHASEVIVVLGANYELIEKEIEHHAITVLKNAEWNLGLGKSIAYAAEHVLKSKSKTQGILFTLGDQPLIGSDFLNKMIQGFSPDESQIVASVYKNDKKGVPVLFDSVYFEELSKLIADNGAKQLLQVHKPFVKTLKPPMENKDIDTPEDYNNLCRK